MKFGGLAVKPEGLGEAGSNGGVLGTQTRRLEGVDIAEELAASRLCFLDSSNTCLLASSCRAVYCSSRKVAGLACVIAYLIDALSPCRNLFCFFLSSEISSPP